MPIFLGRAHRGVVVAAVCLAVVASGGFARAAGDDDAAIRHGLELRRQGKDQEALEEFQKIYARAKSPRALAQVGLAEQALGRWVDAESHVAQALTNETQQPWIHKNSAVLNGALEEIRRHIGSLEVIGPRGAEVRINGQVVGTLPLARPIRLPIGTLNVELQKEGFLPTTRPVSITAGLLTRESIDMQAAPPVLVQPRLPVVADAPLVESRPPSPPSPPSPPAVDPDREPRREASPADNEGGTWRRPVAWGAAVTAVVAAAGGTAALIIRGRKITDANNLQCNIMNGTVNPVDPTNEGRCLDLANSASTMGVAAVVAFSAAGALAIGSAVMFATMPRKSPSAPSVACAPALAVPGAVCRLVF